MLAVNSIQFLQPLHCPSFVLVSYYIRFVYQKSASMLRRRYKMIVFRAIGLNEYHRYNKPTFKYIPIELIEQGEFEIYFDDEQAHQVAKTGSLNNSKWYYVGFVIQYCLKDEYIRRLKKVNGFASGQWLIKTPLKVPKTDGAKINNSIVHDAHVVGFYYNKANLNSEWPMEMNEIRKMQILQHYTSWDPDGLIESCAPRDEYYGEIQEIWSRMTENTTTEELAAIIIAVTEKAFGKKYLESNTDILKIVNSIDLFNKK